MTAGFGPKEFPSLMDDVQATLENLGRMQQERLNLVGRATVRRGRVAATVNADGVLVDLKFGRDASDLDYPELARAVIEAVQQATEDVGRKTKELMAPVMEQKARLPKLSDLIPGMPDLSDRKPTRERAPLAKPVPAHREADAPEEESAPMAFDNVEVVKQGESRQPGVTDSSW